MVHIMSTGELVGDSVSVEHATMRQVPYWLKVRENDAVFVLGAFETFHIIKPSPWSEHAGIYHINYLSEMITRHSGIEWTQNNA